MRMRRFARRAGRRLGGRFTRRRFGSRRRRRSSGGSRIGIRL